MSIQIESKSIPEKIKEIFADVLEIDQSLLENTEKKINEITHIDSIYILDLVTAVEKAFKITISEEDFTRMDSISSVTSIVKEKVSG